MSFLIADRRAGHAGRAKVHLPRDRRVLCPGSDPGIRVAMAFRLQCIINEIGYGYAHVL